MNDPSSLFSNMPVRVRLERDALREGGALLRAHGRRMHLIVSLLLCATAVYACLVFADLPRMALLCVKDGSANGVHIALDAVCYVLLALLLLGVAAPLFLGRLRIAGRMCRGRECEHVELLYYFGNARLYRRALGIALITVLCMALTVALPTLLLGGAIAFFRLVLFTNLPVALTVIFWSVVFVLCAALALLVLLLAGTWLLFPALAAGNESLCLGDALSRALSTGTRNLGTVFRFSLRALGWLLLSLLTLGVLFLFWFSHYYILSYLRLCMMLCPKEN